MYVWWGDHAITRFVERALLYGFNYGEFDVEILAQKVRFMEGNCIKTIFKIQEKYFTVVKKETKEYLFVVSLWESKASEVMLWKNK